MTKPVITLKNLKHAAFASDETECFEATVYVNSKPFCTVSNDGRGGCNMYHGLNSNYWPEVEEMNRIAALLDPTAVNTREEADKINEARGLKGLLWEDFRKALEEKRLVQTKYDVFEDAVNEALEVALDAKDLKKLMAKQIVIISGNVVKQISCMDKHQLQQNLKDPQLKTKLNAEKVLNLLPFDEALSIYRSII